MKKIKSPEICPKCKRSLPPNWITKNGCKWCDLTYYAKKSEK
jgi:hypothetical protein